MSGKDFIAGSPAPANRPAIVPGLPRRWETAQLRPILPTHSARAAPPSDEPEHADARQPTENRSVDDRIEGSRAFQGRIDALADQAPPRSTRRDRQRDRTCGF